MSSTKAEPTSPETKEHPLRIAFVTPYDASDITQASGTGYHIANSLEESGIEVDRIGALSFEHNPLNIFRYLWNSKIRGLHDHPHRAPGFLKHFSRQVEQKIDSDKQDLIVGSGGLPLSYLESDLPIVLWTDSTFEAVHNYYEKFTNMSSRSKRDAERAERSLFNRIDWLIITSQWAADSAINHYRFPADRVTVIPRGANIPINPTIDDIRAWVAKRPTDHWKLVFLGKDWKRKGGDIAEATAVELNRRGFPTTLTIVGERPPDAPTPPDCVKVIGFINKSNPDGWQQFEDILTGAHALLLPTRADCTPIVFNEASALGTPSISTITGAVPSLVREGRNGLLLDLDARAPEYADAVIKMLSDREAYESLCESAYTAYQSQFNWESVAAKASETLKTALEAGKREAPVARPAPVSVFIQTLNEEQNLPECLDSVSWCDDVIVLDSLSTDRTQEICKERGCRLFERQYDGRSAHQNWAMLNIDFKHKWVFYIDADERITPELREEIERIAGDPYETRVAFYGGRKNIFMGRWLKHAMPPGHIMRFFQPEKVRFARPVNPTAIIDGEHGYLKNHFMHYNFSKGLTEWFERHNRYSGYEAGETVKALREKDIHFRELFTADQIRRRHVLKTLSFRMPFRPFLKFIYMYFLKLGLLDGHAGLTYCVLQAIYEYQIVLKVREIKRAERGKST
jgi:glycosyltransferase involved in cell wall biosynthesis